MESNESQNEDQSSFWGLSLLIKKKPTKVCGAGTHIWSKGPVVELAKEIGSQALGDVCTLSVVG